MYKWINLYLLKYILHFLNVMGFSLSYVSLKALQIYKHKNTLETYGDVAHCNIIEFNLPAKHVLLRCLDEPQSHYLLQLQRWRSAALETYVH